jgi:4,5-dihydroxyphthalate decarboxylase
MAMKLRAGHSPNPRLQPLVDGTIKVEGVELEWEFDHPGALFHRQLVEDCYDVFEFSIADYFVVSTRREQFAHLEWQALPVFMSKPLGLLINFHAHESAGVRTFADLGGKSLGVPDYGMTAAVWLRIMLRTLYGVGAKDLTWYNARPSDKRHGRVLGIDQNPTPGLKLINLERDGELNELIQRGEVKIGLADSNSVCIDETPSVRVFSTPAVVMDAVAALYKARGVTPVNHTLAVKKRVLQDDPGLARRLYEAFEASKQEAYRRAREGAAGYLLFPELAFGDQGKLIGEDPFPFGMQEGRRILEHIAEQLQLDGLIQQQPDLDRLWLQPS